MTAEQVHRTILMQDYIDLIGRIDALERKAVSLGLDFSGLSKQLRKHASDACERLCAPVSEAA
jgi:hypothetical protein